jgi:tRNA threonylcarbamoyl adenosine modification protein YeaZ
VTTIHPVILAFDTSSAACTAALFEGGECIARRDELIGRGHAERLVPMIAEMLDGRTADHIIVGVGPGSFTGIRVAIAAAHGLAIGWDAELRGMSSLALLAAGAQGDGEVAAAVLGGHGELFVQQFDSRTVEATSELRNLVPSEAARSATASLVVGSGAERLVSARCSGDARDAWPSAANALKLPEQLRSLPPKPVYARAPDAKVREAA